MGVAGYLGPEDVERLAGIDVDAVHSIGIAGPMTPELLLRIHECDAGEVADFVHTLPLGGPMDPDDLYELLGIGMESVRAAAAASGAVAPESGEVVAIARRAVGD